MFENTPSYEIQLANGLLHNVYMHVQALLLPKTASVVRTSFTSEHLLTHLGYAKSSMISCDSSCYLLCKCSPLSCGIDLDTLCAASMFFSSASFNGQAGQSTTPSTLWKTISFCKLERSRVIVSTSLTTVHLSLSAPLLPSLSTNSRQHSLVSYHPNQLQRLPTI